MRAKSVRFVILLSFSWFLQISASDAKQAQAAKYRGKIENELKAICKEVLVRLCLV
jgi:hypothetical protein